MLLSVHVDYPLKMETVGQEQSYEKNPRVLQVGNGSLPISTFIPGVAACEYYIFNLSKHLGERECEVLVTDIRAPKKLRLGFPFELSEENGRDEVHREEEVLPQVQEAGLASDTERHRRREQRTP